MTAPARLNNPALGIALITIGIIAISINDMLIKFLSGGYPLHQMVFTRSSIGIVFSLILVQIEGGWGILKTTTPFLHLLRTLLLVVANLSFFAALASLPLANTTAIFFVAPLIITLLSIPMLGEQVGALRIGAVCVGFLGVIVVIQPWAGAAMRPAPFYIYLLPLLSALAYALNQLMTRMLGATSRASALAVYVQATFITVSLGFWAVAGDGRFAEGALSESAIFLLRAWVWPQGNDIWYFLGLGLNSAVIGYTLAAAYRMADAATIAPFEYLGLPLAIFWGWLIFGDLPNGTTTAGIALILGSGLFVFLREQQKKRRLVSTKPIHRRY